MREWCKRRAGTLAIVFAGATVALIVVVCFQAAMLHARGWRIPLGTLPEWLAGVGSLATLGVLWLAVFEWRRGQRERRDNEAAQARLIIAEHAPYVDRTWGGMDAPPPASRNVLVRNHSDAPIVKLNVEEHPTRYEGVRVFQRFAHARGRPAEIDVLSGGQATAELGVDGNNGDTPSTECIEFTFTDARGLRWRRLGSAQPERVV